LPLREEAKEEEDVTLIIKLLPGESGSTPSASLQPYSPTLDVFYSPHQIPSSSSSSSQLATFIANKLQELFAEEQALIAYALSTGPPGLSNPSSQPASPLTPELAAALAKRTTRTLKYAPTYHLTFSLFTPGAAPSTWAIESALSTYLTPLLTSFSPISNFTIDTQVQLYARPSVPPPADGLLRRSDLPNFINSAEWPLSPSIGAAPTVNFILYVPGPEDGITALEGGGSSWLIPQWGGVVLSRGPVDNVDALRPVIDAWAHQLLVLLGTPHSGSLPLRLRTLTRVRSAALVLSASSTLGSLARLVVALPGISIPRSVAASVERTIAELRRACEGSLAHAREAEREVERAFFEKSMVGKVYFPDEHKVAVYLPLLGPVGVPLVMGLVKEVKRLVKLWREKR
jgi:phosphatidylinositol glycan class S